jgi:hypothetical protein
VDGDVPKQCTPPPSVDLDVTLKAQEHTYWGWAASAQMIMSALGFPIPQCVQASRFLRATIDCCSEPFAVGCDVVGWPDFNALGLAFRTTRNAPLTWLQIQQELGCARTPFAITWRYFDNSGHMMVASGYHTDSDRWIHVYDPSPVAIGDIREVSYEFYAAGPGSYSHWNDYYGVRR